MLGEALGSCNCSAVKFKVDRAPQDVYICHCSICRRATGSGGIAVTIVAKAEFTWLEGREHIRTWEKPGHDWATHFCEVCGSSLPGKNDEASMYIPVSLFDSGADGLKLKERLFVESKACWEEI